MMKRLLKGFKESWYLVVLGFILYLIIVMIFEDQPIQARADDKPVFKDVSNPYYDADTGCTIKTITIYGSLFVIATRNSGGTCEVLKYN